MAPIITRSRVKGNSESLNDQHSVKSDPAIDHSKKSSKTKTKKSKGTSSLVKKKAKEPEVSSETTTPKNKLTSHDHVSPPQSPVKQPLSPKNTATEPLKPTETGKTFSTAVKETDNNVSYQKNTEKQKVRSRHTVTPISAEKKKEIAQSVYSLYKSISHTTQKPKGISVSGRTWKTEQTSRFTGVKKHNKTLKTSWERKMKEKAEKKSIKTFERQLRETREEEVKKKKEWKANKLKRKRENERKSEVVQVIRNTSKIKRMKKKQLRQLEKR